MILNHATQVRAALRRDDLLLHTRRHGLVALADSRRVLHRVGCNVAYAVHVLATDHVQLCWQVQIPRELNKLSTYAGFLMFFGEMVCIGMRYLFV